eukprot:SAG11_NODE_1975_length_3974_cov_47.788387_3_plen_197_part_00
MLREIFPYFPTRQKGLRPPAAARALAHTAPQRVDRSARTSSTGAGAAAHAAAHPCAAARRVRIGARTNGAGRVQAGGAGGAMIHCPAIPYGRCDSSRCFAAGGGGKGWLPPTFGTWSPTVRPRGRPAPQGQRRGQRQRQRQRQPQRHRGTEAQRQAEIERRRNSRPAVQRRPERQRARGRHGAVRRSLRPLFKPRA